MIQFLFILIIILIIIKKLIDNNNINSIKFNNNDIYYTQKNKITNNLNNLLNNYNNIDKNKNILPWSRILNTNTKKYSKIYCIKIKIPSLNDYENWKDLVSDLNFNSQTE